MTFYIGIVCKEKTGFGICFPDFPGCVSAADTMDRLYAMAAEALQLHVDGMAEDHLPIPQPMSMEEALKHPLAKGGKACMLVRAQRPTRPVRVNVMLDENLIHEIDAVAHNRSAFLTEAARQMLSGMQATLVARHTTLTAPANVLREPARRRTYTAPPASARKKK